MQLTYKELEEFIAHSHLVSPEKRIALQGRLKHFQRAGWPRGTNQGKGSRVQYGVGQTLLLSMSFEMLSLGMRPEQIVQHLKFEVSGLPKLFLSIFDSDEGSEPVLYFFAPDELDVLRSEQAPDQYRSARVIGTMSMLCQNLLPFAEMAGWKNFSAINLFELVKEFASYFAKTKQLTADEFRECLIKWQAKEDQLAATIQQEQAIVSNP